MWTRELIERLRAPLCTGAMAHRTAPGAVVALILLLAGLLGGCCCTQTGNEVVRPRRGEKASIVVAASPPSRVRFFNGAPEARTIKVTAYEADTSKSSDLTAAALGAPGNYVRMTGWPNNYMDVTKVVVESLSSNEQATYDAGAGGIGEIFAWVDATDKLHVWFGYREAGANIAPNRGAYVAGQ